MATSGIPKVVVVDDNPTHIQFYSLLLEGAGFQALPLLVNVSGPEETPDETIALILMDYRLNSVKTAEEVAAWLQQKYPSAPLVVLSGFRHSLPEWSNMPMDSFGRETRRRSSKRSRTSHLGRSTHPVRLYDLCGQPSR